MGWLKILIRDAIHNKYSVFPLRGIGGGRRKSLRLIPESLFRDHEDGLVVFFCGAGVSIPAGLWSFKDLVNRVLDDLLPKPEMCSPGSVSALAWRAFESEQYDEALNILESPGEGSYDAAKVREKIRHHLTKRIKNLQNHITLVRLADLDTDQGRLITTNFDNLFERAIRKLKGRKSSMVSIAPALPPAKRNTLKGLIYLHGKLDTSVGNRDLVVTAADFGTAYLLEGWARRFVIDLFRHYQVVFIGYRVEDPTMRYLVSALAAAREENKLFKQAYVFAGYGDGDGLPLTPEEAQQEWRLKGITALPYSVENGHEQLWTELQEWADDHRQGIIGRQQIVTQLGKLPPLQDDVESQRKMCWALKEAKVAKYFASLDSEDRPDPGWLVPLEASGMLGLPVGESVSPNIGAEAEPIRTPLISRSLLDNSDVNETSFHLGRWLASCLDDPVALDVALNCGGVLHRILRDQVRTSLRQSGSQKQVPTSLAKIWRVLADDGYAHLLALRNCRSFQPPPKNFAPHDTFWIKSFLERLRPIPVFTTRSSWFDEKRSPEKPSDYCHIKIELVGVRSSHDILDLQKRAADWNATLVTSAMAISLRLREAMDWLGEFSMASDAGDSTYAEYRSISEHDQNKHAPTWTVLISLARDSFDALLETGDDAAASRLAYHWQEQPYPVFRRLAIYAATREGQ